jgi:hypothetical protein
VAGVSVSGVSAKARSEKRNQRISVKKMKKMK